MYSDHQGCYRHDTHTPTHSCSHTHTKAHTHTQRHTHTHTHTHTHPPPPHTHTHSTSTINASSSHCRYDRHLVAATKQGVFKGSSVGFSIGLNFFLIYLIYSVSFWSVYSLLKAMHLMQGVNVSVYV